MRLIMPWQITQAIIADVEHGAGRRRAQQAGLRENDLLKFRAYVNQLLTFYLTGYNSALFFIKSARF